MITSYEVGAVFKIADDATPTITRMAQEARALADAIQTVHAQLNTLGRNANLTALSRQFSTLTRNANAAATAVTRATRATAIGPTTASGVPAIRQAAGAGGGGGGGAVVPPAGRYPGGGGWRR